MKSAEYWRRRSEEVAARQFAKADAYLDELSREYARATEEIRRAIEVFISAMRKTTRSAWRRPAGSCPGLSSGNSR